MRLLYIVVCIGLVDALPFLGKKTNYDEITARKLLNMAAGAYGEEKEACLNRTFPPHEMFEVVSSTKEDCDDFDNTCEGYIAASHVTKELAFVFRGTKTKGQLLLEGLQAIHPGVDFFDLGTVNRYFMNGHLVLWPEVEKTLNNPKYAGYKLIFTGPHLEVHWRRWLPLGLSSKAYGQATKSRCTPSESRVWETSHLLGTSTQ